MKKLMLTSNGAAGNAVAGASMYENIGYVFYMHAGKATASSNKVNDSTMAWHSYGVGEKDKDPINTWHQNKWTS